MSISINGSTGISGVDGSAATPALQGGDTNTGISFGTDEVRINTGGTQRAVVDANGRLGLGTSSVSTRLHVRSATDDSTPIIRAQSNNATQHVDLGFYYINYDNGATSAPLEFQIDGSTKMALSSTGLGIGSTAPAANLDVFVDSASDSEIRVRNNVDGLRLMTQADGTQLIRSVFNRGLIFGTGTSTVNATFKEAFRVDGSQRLLVATTTSQGSYNLQCFGTGVWGQGAYVNGSDASLKDNVQDLESALDVVKALRPVTFQYKAEYSQDTSTQSGFIAQELQQAMQGKQYLDGIVKPGTNHLNVAYQGIIAVLVKAVQELEAEVQALKGGN